MPLRLSSRGRQKRSLFVDATASPEVNRKSLVFQASWATESRGKEAQSARVSLAAGERPISVVLHYRSESPVERTASPPCAHDYFASLGPRVALQSPRQSRQSTTAVKSGAS